MIFSTRPYLLFGFLALLSLQMTACMRHKTHDPAVKANQYFGDDADYDVVGTKGFARPEDAPKNRVRGWEEIPEFMPYRFETEVRDASSRNSLRDFPFEILDEDGNSICQAPDLPGGEPKCRFIANAQSQLIWVENIPFDFFKGSPEPVRIVRKIRGLGTRRGTRTLVFQLNPWARSRKLPNEFVDLTFELTRDMAEPLVDPGYRSAQKFRMQNQEDTSELVVTSIDTQLLPNTDPILISRHSREFGDLSEDFQSENIIFSRFSPEEFVRRRPLARQQIIDDPNLTSAQKTERLGQFDNQNVEPIRELIEDNRSIYVYRAKNTATPKIDGFQFDQTLVMKLSYRYPDLISGSGLAEITEGRFRVHAHLVLEPGNNAQPVLLTPGIAPVEGEIARANDLQINYKAIIPYYPSSGVVKLAVKIYPMGMTHGLKPVDRLYSVGTFNQWLGRSGRLVEDQESRDNSFNFDEYVTSAVSGERAFQEGSVDVARDFQLNDLDIRFATIEAGETAAQRTVIFSIGANVFDETTNAPVDTNVPFEVVSLHTDYSNPKNKEKWKFFKITNAEDPKEASRARVGGKVTFFDTITHKYYQTEELVERNIFISKWRPGLDLKKKVEEWAMAEGPDLEARKLPEGVQRLKIYINPWDEKFGTFGRDARAVSDAFLQNVQGREKIPPRFFIGDYGYETLRFRYDIEKDMKLIVKKTVLLNMTPRVLRYASILEGINSIYNLRDGIYLMKVAIQKDYLDPAARNEADIFQIPFKLEDALTNLKSQDEALFDINGQDQNGNLVAMNNNDDFNIDVEARLNEKSQVVFGEKPVTNAFTEDGAPNPAAHSIPYTDSYKDPRRKRAMSMVKKLVRVNSGRVITPVEFSIEDLRLMRIRQQFFVQLEPVNQVRLQMVEYVTQRFEQIFQIELGETSPITDEMTAQEDARIKSLMTRALDAIATAVSDDVYISEIEDLENIIQQPEVVEAFSAFENARFRGKSIDIRLQDILTQIKNDRAQASSLQGDTIAITAEEAQARAEAVTTEQQERLNENSKLVRTLQEITELNKKSTDPRTVQERQCDKLIPVDVTYNENDIDQDAVKRLDAVTKALIPFETGIFKDDQDELISKFQPFANAGEQFFESLVNQETLNQLLKNDFTLTPAFSSVSNLDMLVDQKSGIKARTFVGPMTFLYNTNRGNLRPTDNLDEAYCESDDCNSLTTSIDSQYGEIQNFEYEKSPFHGSIAHFQNVTFNDQEILDPKTGLTQRIQGLESMYRDLQREKLANQRVEGLLTRYLDHFDMSYVSLTDKPIDRLICREDVLTDRCFIKDTEKTVPVDDFISEYSKTVNEVVNVDYQKSADLDLRFQGLVRRPRAGEELMDYDNITDAALPWGFVSPAYQKDMYRCELGLPGLDGVCSSDNEKKRLGGWLGSSYQTEAAYVAPTKEELDEIIRYKFEGNSMVSAGAAEFEDSVESKMCDLLIYGEIGRNAKANIETDQDKLQLRRELFDMSLRCQTDIKNGLSPVVIERKFRIFDTGRYYFLGGKSMNINASQDVRLSTGLRVSRNFGARPLRIVTGIIEKGSGFFLKALALVVGSFDFSYSIQRDRGFYEGTGISSGTYLVMQNAEFEVELTSYEQCLAVRWSPDFVDKYSQYINFYDGKFSEHYVRALFLCSGQTESTPIAVNEKYYYFTQHFTEGDMLDPADIHNHPWLLSLRGVREFGAFMLSLKEWHVDEDTGKVTPEFVHGEEMIDYFDFIGSDFEGLKKRFGTQDPDKTSHYRVTNRQDWPIDQLILTYKRVLPTYPGTYTQLDEKDYFDRSWPWATGQPGSVMESSRNCTQ